MKLIKLLTIIILGLSLVLLTSCDASREKDHDHESHTEADAHKEKVEPSHREDSGHDKDENEHSASEPEIEAHENEIVLEQAAIDMIHLTVEKAQYQTFHKMIILPGEVKANQDRLQHIYPRFSGCVCGMSASIGDVVKKGQFLASIQSNETLTNYDIVSSLDGTVIDKHFTIGENVKEDEEIFTIADLSDVWVEFDIYTKDMDYIKVGQELMIKAVGLTRETIGFISYISPILDTQKRSLTARVVLPNEEGKWSPGIFVKGFVRIPTILEVIAVPNDAIQIVNEKEAVFIPVPDEENTFIPVYVRTGESDMTYTIITSGIKLNDEIVTRGAFELKAKLVTSSLGGHAGHNH
ncbi:MAG: efflux RND transporter periplasmic adaptor subunit [Candidatus Marinimicrobia bacterium]|nr:efflux RND transporter periplasmic adaptor subunit [Candidatus Neomarinimicrobiota bacterium]